MHRLTALFLTGAALLMSSCATFTQAESNGEGPLPTIGLGSDINGDGQATGGANVRLVGSTQIDTVVMVGDSITVASEPALVDVFARLGFDNVIIRSQQSKRIANGSRSNPSGAEVASDLVAAIESGDSLLPDDAPLIAPDDDPQDHSNELWVVALGTNDIAQYSDPAERAAAINEMLNSVPAESMLVWVDTYWRDRPEGTDEFNATIVDRVGQRGNSIIAEWSVVADADGNLRDDGVHPREEGSTAFANAIAAAIVEFLQLA